MKRVAILPAIVAVLAVLVGLRAGLMAALVVAGVAIVVMGGTLLALVGLARQQRPEPVQQSVRHCDCCDQSCLFSPVCEPGPEPTTVHG